MTRIVEGTAALILDTRKMLPGLRIAQKYEVRIGGGENDCLGLYDGIKENHVASRGSVESTIRAAYAPGAGVSVQVEEETLDGLREALDAGATTILLDNFPLDVMRDAVRVSAGRAELEASDGVTVEPPRAIAENGVHRILLSKLTKHVRAVDFSLRFAPFAG